MSLRAMPTFTVDLAVATTTAERNSSLDGIQTNTLADNTLAMVAQGAFPDSAYRFDRFSILAADGTSIIAPLAGPGRWILFSGNSADAPAVSWDQSYQEPIVPGTTATANGVNLPAGTPEGRLVYWSFWSVFDAGAGESMVIRLYRYRRLVSGGPFVFSQLTDPFTYDASGESAFVIDLSSLIRPGFTLVPNDIIAASRVYTVGAGNMVNSLIQWRLGV